MFILAILALVAVGGCRLLTAGPQTPYAHTTNYPSALGLEGLGLFLILKAFSSGCTALTGVEAISNGVPIFKPPEWRNARTTLMVMIGLAVVMFAGITILAHAFQIFPDFTCGPGLPGLLGRPECAAQLPAAQTVLSKLSHVTFGSGPLYFYVQAATALILVLAANTSFADFPRLLYLMARDKYAPHQFVNLGERLAFSNGIIALGVLSGGLYPIAVVPVSDLSEPHLQALALARRIADEVVAVFISDSPERIQEIREKWKAWGGLVPLEVIESPYRSLVRPFMDYLDAVEAQNQHATIMVVLPELVYSRWWHQFLHNQTALRLKAALLFRPGTVVINVPYHL